MAQFNIYETKYGYKVAVEFAYDKHMIEQIKSLSWDQTHRRWRPDRKAWEMDVNEQTIDFLTRHFNVPDQVRTQLQKIIGGYEPCVWLEGNVIKIQAEYGEQLAEDLSDIDATFVGDHWELERTSSNIMRVANALGIDPRNKDTIKIIVSPVFSIINTHMPHEVNSKLRTKLSFRPQDAEWTDGFQRGTWDGLVHLYSQQQFPTGLLPLVKDVVAHRFNLDIEDRRSVSDVNLDITSDYELRSYQVDVKRTILQRPIGTISMPTGSGKTVLGLDMIADIGKPTIILVHRQELLYQWINEIVQNLHTSVGKMGDGDTYEKNITVGMLQTLQSHKLENDYDVLIADEVHHIPAETFRHTASNIEAKYRYGLSATPFRNDNKGMLIWAVTGPISVKVEPERLVADEWLARPRFVIVDYDSRTPTHGQWHQIYKRCIVGNKSRNTAIANIADNLNSRGYDVLVDVHRIKHGRILTNMIGDAKFICGEDSSSTRQHALKSFSDDNFVLVSTLIKEGVNLPEMNAVILAGGMKSSIQVIQTIGRSLRPKEGTNEALIIDMKDRGKYVGGHFEQRKSTLRNYYTSLYEPEVVNNDNKIV